MSPTNILWICTDSQRFDTLGCYGNEFVKTPNIDRLAREGMLFENCFVQNPLCTPSRGCFLTGRYPVTNKLRKNGQNILPSESEYLVPRILRDDADYVCGLSGKLHLSACNRRLILPEYVNGGEWWKLPSEEQLVQGIEPRIDDGYHEFYWDHAPSPEFRSSAYNAWVQAKGAKIEMTKRDDSKSVTDGMPEDLHQTTFCCEKAIEFIHRYQDYGHGWLFSVNIFDPHFGVNPPKEYLEPYLDGLDKIPLPNYVEGELENKPCYQKEVHEHTLGGYKDSDGGDPHEHRMLRAGYWAMCDLIDKQVGRVLDALEETGQRENTLVIFTSDHGEMLGDHGLYIKGPFLYDPAVQVPLIFSMPGTIPQNVRATALVELGDLAPTVLEATGQPVHPGMQAKSLWPLLTGKAPADTFREDVYCEYYNANPEKEAVFLTMVRNHETKIILNHRRDIGELYDLTTDPAETNNLWDDPEYKDLKLQMVLRAATRMAETADPMPRRIGIF